MLLLTQASLIQENMDGYTKHLITMQNDPSQQVRWRIVQGINAVMELRIDIIMSIFEEVANLMIKALMENDQKVALAATEFWSGMLLNHCEDPQQEKLKVRLIHERLPVLMLELLKCCKYTDHDRMANQPSKDSDIGFDERRSPK